MGSEKLGGNQRPHHQPSVILGSWTGPRGLLPTPLPTRFPFLGPYRPGQKAEGDSRPEGPGVSDRPPLPSFHRFFSQPGPLPTQALLRFFLAETCHRHHHTRKEINK